MSEFVTPMLTKAQVDALIETALHRAYLHKTWHFIYRTENHHGSPYVHPEIYRHIEVLETVGGLFEVMSMYSATTEDSAIDALVNDILVMMDPSHSDLVFVPEQNDMVAILGDEVQGEHGPMDRRISQGLYQALKEIL